MSRAVWEGDLQIDGANVRGRVVSWNDGRLRVRLVTKEGTIDPSYGDALAIGAECLHRSMAHASFVADIARAAAQGVQSGRVDATTAFERLREAALNGPPEPPAASEVPGRKRAPGGDGNCG